MQAHLHFVRVALQVKLQCAEGMLPFVLRTGDYYALRSEGQRLDAVLEAAVAASQEPSNGLELAQEAYAYHDRLAAYLMAVEDTYGCGTIPWNLERLDAALEEKPAAPQGKKSGSITSGLVWGGVVALAVGAAGWALSR